MQQVTPWSILFINTKTREKRNVKTPLIYSTSIDTSYVPGIVTGPAEMMAIKADWVHVLRSSCDLVMYRYKGAPVVLPCLAGYPRTTLNAYKDWDRYDPYCVLPWAVLGGSVGKEFTCNTGDTGSTPRLGRSPGGGLATHSSILAWEILWTEEPGGLQSMWSQTVRHSWSSWAHRHTCIRVR